MWMRGLETELQVSNGAPGPSYLTRDCDTAIFHPVAQTAGA
jgi:hypothetical protein